MKIDGGVCYGPDVAASTGADTEKAGYDGIWVAETTHDPFLSCLLAAEHTSRIEVGTSVAIAFARSPMTLAYSANDLQMLSKGRFILGIGSQIKPHIEKRFSMPWSHPAARMREYVMALRAIWTAWHNEEGLDFRGDFYNHTLMTPFFSAGPNEFGAPKVLMAGVGELMTEVAGEVCDGFICHGFTTEKYLREVTVPALERGRAKAGKTLGDFEICGPTFVVTGADEATFEAAALEARQQLAFYASTPAYRPVLDLHGWGDLQLELHALSKRGAWAEMPALIDDDFLHTFAVVGEPAVIGAEILRRYGDLVGRITLPAAQSDNPGLWEPILTSMKQAR